MDAMRRGPVTTVLRGGSMQPCIPHGARVSFRTLRDRERMTPGLVVALCLRGRLVVHRVCDVTAEGAWVNTRGDSVTADDGWVARDDVLAVATDVWVAGRRHPLSTASAAWWWAAAWPWRAVNAWRERARSRP